MEPNKDRLEEYFRKSLESLGDEPSPGGWDLPSEHVWKGIEGGILPMSGASGLGVKALLIKYGLYAALTVAVGYAALHYHNHRKDVREMQQVIVKQQQAIADMNETLMNIEKEQVPISLDTPLIEQKHMLQNEISEDLLTQNTQAGNRSSFSVEREKALVNSRPGSSTGNATDSFNDPNKSVSIAYNTSEISDVRATARLSNLDALKKGIYLLTDKKLTPTLTYEWNMIKPINGAYSNTVTVGAFLSPVYSHRSIYHKEKGISTPYEKAESPQVSYTAGLNFGIPIGRNLGLSSGIYYSNLHLHSMQTIGLRFTTIGGIKDSLGNSVNRYRTKLETSFGPVELESRVASNNKSAQGMELNEGRPFPIKYEADMHLNQLTVPLLLQYHIGTKRFGVMLKSGIAGTFMLNHKLDIKKVHSLDKDLRHLETNILNEKVLNTTHKFTLDLYAAAGFRASLTPRIDFNIEPSFRKNITPVFEDQKIETRMFALSFQTGLTFKL
jgi:hypothetical protein